MKTRLGLLGSEVAKYHAFVSRVDSVVGMILDKLAETGNYEDTRSVHVRS